MEGRGVRCVSTGDWVTAAETAECVLSLDALGMDEAARDLLASTHDLRRPDGSYWTGLVHPDRVTFPEAECTTYTSAAVILAADALSGTSGAAGLFRGQHLPASLDLPESACPGPAAGCTARS